MQPPPGNNPGAPGPYPPPGAYPPAQPPPGQYAQPPAGTGQDDGTPKIVRGCGGCGCIFAVLLLLAGGVLTAFGTQRATREAMPFGIICLVLMLPAAGLGGGMFAWGHSKLKGKSNLPPLV